MMKTKIKIANKTFYETLRVTFDGQTKELSDENREIEFESSNNGKHTLEVEFVNNDFFDFNKVRNPIAKFLLRIVAFIFMPLLHYFEADDIKGAKSHMWLKYTHPFDFRKTFIVEPQEDKPIALKFTDSYYKPKTRDFSFPNVEIFDCIYKEENEYIKFHSEHMKKAYKIINIPMYVFVFVVLALLFTVFALVGRQALLDVVNRTSAENLFGAIGMVFCFAVLLFILIMAIKAVVRSYKLCDEICEKYEA